MIGKPLIDFHSHIDLYESPKEIIDECVRRNMYVLSVTTTPKAWERTSRLANNKERIRTALGFHPEIASARKNELGLFDELLPQTRYVGEVGLDGSTNLKETLDDQKYVFKHILSKCETDGGKIISIHSRRAVPEVLELLEAHKNAGVFVLHWYSGSQKDLKKATELGCWFSVGPSMIFGEKGRALIAKMPMEKVLTETDGPFANVQERPLYPWDVTNVITELAKIWDMAVEAAYDRVQENFKKLITTY